MPLSPRCWLRPTSRSRSFHLFDGRHATNVQRDLGFLQKVGRLSLETPHCHHLSYCSHSPLPLPSPSPPASFVPVAPSRRDECGLSRLVACSRRVFTSEDIASRSLEAALPRSRALGISYDLTGRIQIPIQTVIATGFFSSVNTTALKRRSHGSDVLGQACPEGKRHSMHLRPRRSGIPQYCK